MCEKCACVRGVHCEVCMWEVCMRGGVHCEVCMCERYACISACVRCACVRGMHV